MLLCSNRRGALHPALVQIQCFRKLTSSVQGHLLTTQPLLRQLYAAQGVMLMLLAVDLSGMPHATRVPEPVCPERESLNAGPSNNAATT
jgi:hypothetical protein